MRLLRRLTLLATLLVPWPSLAQEDPDAASIRVQAPDVRAVTVARCSPSDRDPIVARAGAILGAGASDDSLTVLRGLERRMRSRLRDAPDDVETRFRLATVIAVRLELDDGEEVELAHELHRHAARIVALEPRHGGAHHMLGRLHAAVMRLSGFKRFLARTFVGGELLARASWTEARRHLELAEALEPCVPDHHYELARLLFERGQDEDAMAEIEHVRSLRGSEDSRGLEVARKADVLVRRMDRSGSRAP